MAVFEIPLAGEPETFTISLAGVEYAFKVWFKNVDQGGWVIDIAYASGAPLINGIPLVTGIDLLGQYAYLGIGGQLWVAGDGGDDAAPTFDNLGSSTRLYFVTP